MYRIAIALIVFQLIGCAKSSVVTTRPENKQEEETPQGDTPQAPKKTNYLKIGAYNVGVILVSLAIVGIIIAYCCTRKWEKKVPVTNQEEQDRKVAEEIAKQNEADIDRIVAAIALKIQENYSDIRDFILQVYPDKGGLEATLKWHFLKPVPKRREGVRPGETYLSHQRKYTKEKLDGEVELARAVNPKMSMSEVFTNIDHSNSSFIEEQLFCLRTYQRTLGLYTMSINKDGVKTSNTIMNIVARLVYYDEFKNALIENER
jgi:hypothetical protein